MSPHPLSVLAHPDLVGSRWSVVLHRAGEAEPAFVYEPDRILSTASVGKVFVLIELAHRIAIGECDPMALLDRREAEPVADSGLWQHLSVDALPVNDVARLVGSVSDNLATNVLVAHLGLERIQARARQWVPDETTLHDLVRDARGPDDPATLSSGSAASWAGVLQRLLSGEEQQIAVPVLGWLSTNTDLSMVADAFDLDPLAHGCGPERGWSVWNKTGTDAGVRADIGIVETPGTNAWTYAVICNWDPAAGDLVAPVRWAMRAIGLWLREQP